MAKSCIIIAGPTASGKTALAVQVAKAFGTEIISADSRQCFRELNIGVAKPSAEQLQEVRHYFISSHSIHDPVNAAVFRQYALSALEEIFRNHDNAVVAGGTGLYIKALCEGIDEIPEVAAGIRQEIRMMYAQHGLAWLQQQVRHYGLYELHEHEINNPQRLMRSLEVKLSTGRSIRSFHSQPQQQSGFNCIKLALQLPRDTLYHNINSRVDQMVAAGLVDEVTALMPFRHLNALNTVGYKELFAYLEGTAALQDAINGIRQHTRQYAKRQVTWFNNDTSFHPVNPLYHEVMQYLEGVIT